MGSSCFLPLYPHPSSAAWPWGTLVGWGGGRGAVLWTVFGGGCLCSMSVLLKSLFIIRNITPTYVQHCLVLCFGVESWVFFWRMLGVLGCVGIPGDGDTEVRLCCHPWVLVQKAKSLGWGVFGGAPTSSAAPRLCMRPPYLVSEDAVRVWGCCRDTDLGVPGESGVHRAVGTLTWGQIPVEFGVCRDMGAADSGGSLQHLGCSGGAKGLIWVRSRCLRDVGGLRGTGAPSRRTLCGGEGGTRRAAEGSRGAAVLRPRRGAGNARGMLGAVVQRREACREL